FLYCTDVEFGTSSSDQCGGIGAYCQDPTQIVEGNTDAQNAATSNGFCASGYCNAGTAQCDVRGGEGADCSTDPEFFCGENAAGQDLYCDASTSTCQVLAAPSGRARARRNLLKINSCASGHEACPVEGTSGFECIETLSNLEQCGGCASSGKGVDCTTLPGVQAVGCEAGVCQIWSCLDNFTYDADSESCVPL
ncbi:uncharacterized protein JCM6883_006292, partial [Sporobolomyces salmoneus]|uniref:uncharacterized protein n=1 Tax=Sporobolomyces salmoneus TaxID=183962 RepID=UPI003180B93F